MDLNQDHISCNSTTIIEGILSFVVGGIIMIIILVLMPKIAMDIQKVIPPEHGIMRLCRQKYSRYIRPRYLKW
jgi:hypothetical protein